MAGSEDDEVGYGKPPKHSRFKKGQPSPNPNGRPRKTPSFLDHVDAELRTKVTIKENGRKRRPTKEALIAKQVVNGAVKGDRTMLKLAQPLLMMVDERRRGQIEALTPRERDRLDKAVMATILGFLPQSSPPAEEDDV